MVGSYTDRSTAVVALDDGGWVILGDHGGKGGLGTLGAGTVHRYDAKGAIVWRQHGLVLAYGKSHSEARGAVLMADGTVLVAGIDRLSGHTRGMLVRHHLKKAKSLTVGCDDGKFCTTGRCGISDGCVLRPRAARCEDNNSCTERDSCVQGVCKAGPPRTPDDANPCTTDKCLAASGDWGAPTAEGKACADGKQCKVGSCGPCVYGEHHWGIGGWETFTAVVSDTANVIAVGHAGAKANTQQRGWVLGLGDTSKGAWPDTAKWLTEPKMAGDSRLLDAIADGAGGVRAVGWADDASKSRRGWVARLDAAGKVASSGLVTPTSKAKGELHGARAIDAKRWLAGGTDGGKAAWFVELDPGGKVAWQASVAQSTRAAGLTAVTPDPKGVAGAGWWHNTANKGFGLVVALDAKHAVRWQHHEGDGVHYTRFDDVVRATDGDLVAGGVHYPWLYGRAGRLLRLSPDGKVRWRHVQATQWWLTVRALLPLPGGDIVAAGNARSGASKAQVMRWSKAGKQVWRRTIGMGSVDLRDIAPHPGGGYVLAGAQQVHKQDANGWLARISATGRQYCGP